MPIQVCRWIAILWLFATSIHVVEKKGMDTCSAHSSGIKAESSLSLS